MQIIDELEVNKRGPYGGGIGYVAYNGNMDVALALRTMVIPSTSQCDDSSKGKTGGNGTAKAKREWTVHLQVSCTVCRSHSRVLTVETAWKQSKKSHGLSAE